MFLPIAAFFVVRRNKGIYFVKDKSGLWALPGGILKETYREGFRNFAHEQLYPYFDKIEIRKLRLIVAPREKVSLGDRNVRCFVFFLKVHCSPKETALQNLWLAPMDTLVPQVVSPDIRWMLRYIERFEMQSRRT